MKHLRSLWRGDLPLGEAFWTWTVLIGLFVNLSTTILFLTLMTLDLLWTALLAGYAVSVPYNVIAVVGVWRSAERHQGPSLQADLARAASVILMAVLSIS